MCLKRRGLSILQNVVYTRYMSKLLLVLLVYFWIPAFAGMTGLDGMTVQAQEFTADIASTYEVTDPEAVDGDILIYSEGNILRASKPYDSSLFGVMQATPLIVFQVEGDTTGKPIARAGTATVNVINANGPIKAGDYITSSSAAGKGQKATISGYVIGTALKDMNDATGRVEVAMSIGYAELTNSRTAARLLDNLNVAAFESAKDPEKLSQVMKYFSAGFVVMGSLVFSLIIFGRSITKGIEAIGRNPLAKSTIQVSIMLSALMTVGIILLSIGAAFVIIKI